ncbi:MAG: hypothetical protein LBM70_05205 [Victivallales bacterium]|jgi:tetratricopeptide (TPR) repeat protein|nr:hypothetical protein [Victivallales bacterium]
MLRERLEKVAKLLIMLVLCAMVMRRFFAMASEIHSGGSPVAAGYYYLEAIAFLFVIGILFVLFYLPGISRGAVDFLILPQRFRKRPAPLVGQVNALIKQCKYDEALTRLDQLIEESPQVPFLWFLRFDILHKYLKLPEDALQTAEHYLSQEKRESSEFNVQLVLRYAELLRDLGRFDSAESLLDSEMQLHRREYTKLERKMLANMKNSIENSRNGVAPSVSCYHPLNR